MHNVMTVTGLTVEKVGAGGGEAPAADELLVLVEADEEGHEVDEAKVAEEQHPGQPVGARPQLHITLHLLLNIISLLACVFTLLILHLVCLLCLLQLLLSLPAALPYF